MMNTVDHGMQHQFPQARRVFRTTTKGPLNDSIEIFVAEL